MKTYTIKPLKWSESRCEWGVFICWEACPDPFTVYQIWKDDDGLFWINRRLGRGIHRFKTLAEAKAHFQMEHEKKVAKFLKVVK